MLSDEEWDKCKLADANSTEHFDGRAAAIAAYALGIERGKKERETLIAASTKEGEKS